jgi:Mrp family chromosome partitioning ATPase
MSKILEALDHAQADARPRDARNEVAAPGPVPARPGPSGSGMLAAVSMEEEMVVLRQRIEVLLPDHPNRAIEFIGSRAGEGTSTVAGEFARVSATRFRQRVLLLQMDPHGREQGHPGVGSDHSADSVGRFDIAPLPEEFLAASVAAGSPGAVATWARFRAAYDLIVIDAPPATTSPHGLALARYVDGVVLVLAAEDTRWPVADRVKQSIERSGGRVLGVVLNKRQYHIPRWVYQRL